MPAAYQGTVIRASGVPIHDLAPPEGLTPATQRLLLDRLRRRTKSTPPSAADSNELAARIASYELAFKDANGNTPGSRQASPKETDETKELYGIRWIALSEDFRPEMPP